MIFSFRSLSNYVNLVFDIKYKGQDILENKLYYYKKRVMRGIRL